MMNSLLRPLRIVSRCRAAPLVKFGRQGDPHFRNFQVTLDCTELLWFSAKKSATESRVKLQNCRILEGQITEVFRRQPRADLIPVSFSLEYEEPKTRKQRTLDLVCNSPREYDSWVTALRFLIVQGPPPSGLLDARRRVLWAGIEHGSGRTTVDLSRRIKDTNDVFAWGQAPWGQLGLGDEAPRLEPTLLPSLLGKAIRSVSCGLQHTLAVADTGETYAWGHGGSGRLGCGGTDYELSPRQLFVGGSAGGSEGLGGDREPLRFRVASAGDMHSLALSLDGTPYAWGCGYYGATGHAARTDMLVPTRVPLFVSAMFPARPAADSGGQASAVASSAPPPATAATPMSAASANVDDSASGPGQPFGLQLCSPSSFVSVVAGTSYSLFVDSAGVAYSCGIGDAPLGHSRADLAVLLRKRSLACDPAAASVILASATESEADWAVSSTVASVRSELQAFANAAGLVSASEGPASPVPFSVARGAGGGVTGFQPGSTSAQPRRSDAALGARAIATPGRRGAGDLSVPLQLFSGFDAAKQQVLSASCGLLHAAIVTSGGHCYQWGWNGCGQLGVGDTVSREVPTRIAAVPLDAIAVACGGSHSLVLVQSRSTGLRSVYACGSTSAGQVPLPPAVLDTAVVMPQDDVPARLLASGSAAQTSVPSHIRAATLPVVVQLPSLPSSNERSRPASTVAPSPVAVAAGVLHSAVVMDDGTIFTFGDGSSGALGISGLSAPEAWRRVRKFRTKAVAQASSDLSRTSANAPAPSSLLSTTIASPPELQTEKRIATEPLPPPPPPPRDLDPFSSPSVAVSTLGSGGSGLHVSQRALLQSASPPPPPPRTPLRSPDSPATSEAIAITTPGILLPNRFDAPESRQPIDAPSSLFSPVFADVRPATLGFAPLALGLDVAGPDDGAELPGSPAESAGAVATPAANSDFGEMAPRSLSHSWVYFGRRPEHLASGAVVSVTELLSPIQPLDQDLSSAAVVTTSRSRPGGSFSDPPVAAAAGSQRPSSLALRSSVITASFAAYESRPRTSAPSLRPSITAAASAALDAVTAGQLKGNRPSLSAARPSLVSVSAANANAAAVSPSAEGGSSAPPRGRASLTALRPSILAVTMFAAGLGARQQQQAAMTPEPGSALAVRDTDDGSGGRGVLPYELDVRRPPSPTPVPEFRSSAYRVPVDADADQPPVRPSGAESLLFLIADIMQHEAERRRHGRPVGDAGTDGDEEGDADRLGLDVAPDADAAGGDTYGRGTDLADAGQRGLRFFLEDAAQATGVLRRRDPPAPLPPRMLALRTGASARQSIAQQPPQSSKRLGVASVVPTAVTTLRAAAGTSAAASGATPTTVAVGSAITPPLVRQPSGSSAPGSSAVTPRRAGGAGTVTTSRAGLAGDDAALQPVRNTVLCGPLQVVGVSRREVRSVSCGLGFTVCLVATAWMRNEEAAYCMRCELPFGLTRRKHHCRNCGGLFCVACSSKRMRLLKLGHIEPVRTCDSCFSMLARG